MRAAEAHHVNVSFGLGRPITQPPAKPHLMVFDIPAPLVFFYSHCLTQASALKPDCFSFPKNMVKHRWKIARAVTVSLTGDLTLKPLSKLAS